MKLNKIIYHKITIIENFIYIRYLDRFYPDYIDFMIYKIKSDLNETL